MRRNGWTLAFVVTAVVVTALVVIGALWAGQRSQLASRQGPTLRPQAEVEERVAETETAGPVGTPRESKSASSSIQTEHPKKKAPAERSRQFAFIASLVYGRPGRMTADYAQFLTGTAAVKAEAKAGDESPPPNDYYIVNDSRNVRRLAVDPSAEVRLNTKPGEGSLPDGYASDVETLARYFSADREEWASFKANGYWLTLEDGLVVGIEEQYAP
jgi:cytoskeletal protein RodZ